MELIYKHESYAIIGACCFICYEKIILEIKALSALCDEHRAQVLNYLNATDCKLGLLVNFGHYPKQYERLLSRHYESAELQL